MVKQPCFVRRNSIQITLKTGFINPIFNDFLKNFNKI